jgi:uncharacterized SAM-binding protein YcdF (DUF218 family)
MFLLKKIVASIILPPFGLILLALAGLWLSHRHPKTGRTITVLSLLMLLALSMPLVSGTLMRSLEQHGPISPESLSRAQAIVVLGGGSYRNAPEYGQDTVGIVSLERARYGVYLQRQSGLPILVTGGAPFGGKPEAELMASTIRDEFGGRVRWVENASRDTAENALLSAPLLREEGFSRIALVSNVWHLPRAVAHFEQAGLEVLPAPMGFSVAQEVSLSDFLPHAGALAGSSRAIQEWLGKLVQRIQSAKLF